MHNKSIYGRSLIDPHPGAVFSRWVFSLIEMLLVAGGFYYLHVKTGSPIFRASYALVYLCFAGNLVWGSQSYWSKLLGTKSKVMNLIALAAIVAVLVSVSWGVKNFLDGVVMSNMENISDQKAE